MQVSERDRVEGFVLERQVGVGGMGRVYRAVEERTGEVVALKIMRFVHLEAIQRFDREVRLLRQIRHAGIVRCVADGSTRDGRRWLAMEWLEGEPLGRRIARGPMCVRDVVEIGREIAEALTALHAAGIVHRDIKPHNIFLQEAGGAKVLDLGIGRHVADTLTLTRTGEIIGSFHYLAPEQIAGGAAVVDPRADVFSLGCVLYECATGCRAFIATDAPAALAKILLEEPTPIEELQPDTPPALVDLVRRMMSKAVRDRPTSAAVASALAALATSSTCPRSEAIGRSERRFVCVVLAKEVMATATRAAAHGVLPAAADVEVDTLRQHAVAYGGELALLADGNALVTFSGELALDAVPRATRCALAMRRVLGDRPVAVALGPGIVDRRSASGAVIAAATAALDEPSAEGVRIVGVPAELLESWLDVRADADGLVAVGVRKASASRTLLGRETRCVGRDRELDIVEHHYEACVQEPAARVALVTGAVGVGKSRLRVELLHRLAASASPPRVLFGAGDAVGAGAPFSTLRSVILSAAGAWDLGQPSAQASALAAHVSALLSDRAPEERAATAALLGEMCGVPVPAPAAVAALRGDARGLGDAMRAAFVDWLRAQTWRGPVVFVIEDVHWVDPSTLRVLDHALRTLDERALFVLGVGRPEASERFPRLWQDHAALRVSLGPLSRDAQRRLVRDVLHHATDGDVERLVSLSDGNAFFLEELVRAFAAGDASAPSSVLSIVQARLDAIGPELRRVCRAASVLGTRFAASALQALVPDVQLQPSLAALCRLEIVRAGPGGRAFEFTHSMIRDAAYALLDDEDRRRAHLRAAEWFESQGAIDALVLVEHLERAGCAERSVDWLERAAAQALGGDDLVLVIALTERGVALSRAPEQRGRLLCMQAEAHRWRGDVAHALAASSEAVDVLPRGSPAYFIALGELSAARALSGDMDGACRCFDAARAEPAALEARVSRALVMARAGMRLLDAGRYAEVDALLAEIVASELVDDRLRATLKWLGAHRALCAGDLGAFVDLTVDALAGFRSLADTRNTCSHRTNLGYAYAELGDYARAEEHLRRVLHEANRLELPIVVAYALHNLGNAVACRGRLEEALTLATRAADVASRVGDQRIEGAARAYLGKIALAAGERAFAARESERAIALLGQHPALRAVALAVRGLVHLATERADEALRATAAATALLDDRGAFEDGETLVRLTRARAVLAADEPHRAAAVAHHAKERLLARAARIQSPAWRASLLNNVAESRDTITLADELVRRSA